MSQSIDNYIDYLRDVRRMSPNTLSSYARDLRALAEFAESHGRAIEILERRDLEAFTRQLMTSGLAPRSVARSIACVRGLLQVSADRKEDRLGSRGGSASAARLAGAAQVSRHRAGRSTAGPARCVHSARGPRQGADRGALCDGFASHRATVAESGRHQPRRRLPDLHRQGRQAAHRAARRLGGGLDTALHRGGASGAAEGAKIEMAVRQREGGRTTLERRLLEGPEGVRHQGGRSRATSARTSCGTRSRRTCSIAAPICAPSR